MSLLRGVALRLHGPLQAWGGPVVGDDRPTLPIPTRSGVLGLVAACLGIRRTETARLLALAEGSRVHIRVDAPGAPLVDDQTIQGNPNASHTRQTIQSKRTYLCDASFVAVVVPGPAVSPGDVARALEYPVFSPSLGRRACVPSSPLLLAPAVTGEHPIDLFAGLDRYPLDTDRTPEGADAEEAVDYYLDVPDDDARLRRIAVRDHLAGPLPRQFRERWVVHVRRSAPLAARTSDAIDPWLTSELS